jgi:hypothetical protein
VCRSIKVLRDREQVATREEIAAAALQFVRKVSGCRKPSRANQPAFDAAVAEVAEAAGKLLHQFVENYPARKNPG